MIVPISTYSVDTVMIVSEKVRIMLRSRLLPSYRWNKRGLSDRKYRMWLEYGKQPPICILIYYMLHMILVPLSTPGRYALVSLAHGKVNPNLYVTSRLGPFQRMSFGVSVRCQLCYVLSQPLEAWRTHKTYSSKLTTSGSLNIR